MKDKLIAIIEKYDLLAKQMASPEIFSNQEKLTLIAKEHRSLEEIVIVSKKYISLLDQIADDRTILEGEDDDLKENHSVILTVPYYDSGGIHPQTDELLDKCHELKIPVIIDSAYMIIANKIEFNFDRDCIESVCFSLSKGFYGAEKLRIGLRLSKKFTDDGIEVFNLMEMVNMVGVYVGHQIIKYFPHDYNVNTFRSRQSDFCYSMNLKRSNCVIFGLADKDDPKYKEHDRGTDFRRVCLSPLLGDMEDLHYV